MGLPCPASATKVSMPRLVTRRVRSKGVNGLSPTVQSGPAHRSGPHAVRTTGPTSVCSAPMNRMHVWGVAGLLGSVLWGCSHAEKGPPDRVETRTETVELPRPYTTDSVRKFSKVRGWPEGKAPVAEGFTVKRYAADLV